MNQKREGTHFRPDDNGAAAAVLGRSLLDVSRMKRMIVFHYREKAIRSSWLAQDAADWEIGAEIRK